MGLGAGLSMPTKGTFRKCHVIARLGSGSNGIITTGRGGKNPFSSGIFRRSFMIASPTL